MTDDQTVDEARALTRQLVEPFLQAGERPLFKAYGRLTRLPEKHQLGFGWLVVTDRRVHLIDAVSSRPVGPPWLTSLIGLVELRHGEIAIDGYSASGRRLTYTVKTRLEGSSLAFIRDLRHIIVAEQRWSDAATSTRTEE